MADIGGSAAASESQVPLDVGPRSRYQSNFRSQRFHATWKGRTGVSTIDLARVMALGGLRDFAGGGPPRRSGKTAASARVIIPRQIRDG